MEKRELYDSFVQLEADMKRMLARIDEMQTDMTQILERNAELEIENQHLREHLQEIQSEEVEHQQATKQHEQTPQLSKSRANLEKLYEEGSMFATYVVHGASMTSRVLCLMLSMQNIDFS